MQLAFGNHLDLKIEKKIEVVIYVIHKNKTFKWESSLPHLMQIDSTSVLFLKIAKTLYL